MQLGLTLPLQRFLGCKLPPCREAPDLAFCWDLHLLRQGRSRGLILVNCSSRFAVYLHGMKKAEWDRLPQLAAEQLARALAQEGIPPALAGRYLLAAGAPELTGTHGRRPVAGLNRAVECLRFYTEDFEPGLEQPELDRHMNLEICHAAGFPDYGYPREFLRADLERLFPDRQQTAGAPERWGDG